MTDEQSNAGNQPENPGSVPEPTPVEGTSSVDEPTMNDGAVPTGFSIRMAPAGR